MKRLLRYLSLPALLISSVQIIDAQNVATSDSVGNYLLKYETGNFPKKAYEVLKQFTVSGYYRFVTNYRHLGEAYPHLENNRNNIFVGDDSQMPQMMLNISGSTSKNTSFGTDLFLWTPMTGQGEPENVKGLNLGISLYGTFNTGFCDLTLRTGGINWFSMTPFTFQSNKGYDRYSIFERNPWDPNTRSLDSRYSTFYNAGAINQDERWGQQAFQGLIAEGNNFPNGFSGVFMYGKTQLNGGLSPLPNNSFGGRIKKTYGVNYISINTFNNSSFTDSLQTRRIGFNIVSLEFRNQFNGLLIKGEAGSGRTIEQEQTNDWGEAISLKLSTDILGNFPTEMHVYRISPKVVNNSAAFVNSSFEPPTPTTINGNIQPVLPLVASAMVPIGQLVNNRQGFDINSQVNIGKVKTSFGYSNSMEIDNLSSKITYGHPVNSLVLSHFWRWNFPTNVGPYGNLSKIYRTVYETVNLTELDPGSHLPLKKKYFNSLELNLKYKGELLKKDYYIYYLGQFNSVQNKMAPITIFSEAALVRTYYHQLEFYYKVNNKLIWTNYIGFERILANYNTETDIVSHKPKNQTGYSLATGLDILMSKGAGLYLRQRWMQYHDSSFENDHYKGFESTVEIKIFF